MKRGAKKMTKVPHIKKKVGKKVPIFRGDKRAKLVVDEAGFDKLNELQKYV